MDDPKFGVTPVATVGAAVVLFTLAGFFLLGFAQSSTNVLALLFLLVAEIVLFLGLFLLRLVPQGNPVLLHAGMTSALGLYAAATFVSVWLAGPLQRHTGFFVFLELAIITAFVITAAALMAGSRAAAASDGRDAGKVGDQVARRGGF